MSGGTPKMPPGLHEVAQKVESAERLDFEDGLRLVQSNDTLGPVDQKREQRP